MGTNKDPIDIYQAPKIEEYYLYDPNSSMGTGEMMLLDLSAPVVSCILNPNNLAINN